MPIEGQHCDEYYNGAAIAFGLMGMAFAIQEMTRPLSGVEIAEKFGFKPLSSDEHRRNIDHEISRNK